MPHSIPTTHSNEQKIIQDGRRNLPSILFAKGGTNIYIYPENLRAKAMLWLWPLRDVAIIGTGFILSVLALAQSGFLPPLVATFLFAFLSIRVEDASILDFLRYAVNFLFLKQQYYEWGERKSWHMVQTPAKTQVLGRGGFHALVPLDEGELHIGAVKNFGLCFRPVPVQIFSVFQPVFHGLVRDIRKQVSYPPLKIFPGHSVRVPQCPRCSWGPAGQKLSTRIR